jgi:hypothetical protein
MIVQEIGVSGDPKADCESLLNAVLPFAQQMLNRHGEFYPYGGAMTTDGQITSVAARDGEEHPASADVIQFLKSAFVAGARQGKYRATALVHDVRVRLPSDGRKSDAIAVSLNHRNDYSVTVVFPYTIENAKAVIGPAFAQKGEADVFRSPQ